MKKGNGISYDLIKKLLVVAMAVICMWKPSIGSAAVDDQQESEKSLYIVYDNSISMLNNTDAWCQAAYAIETIAALTGDYDDIHLYLMSDYAPYFYREDFSKKGNGEYQVYEDVHETLKAMQYTRSTHKDGLLQAINDIKADTANDKSLLIFSDGVFNSLKGEKNTNPIDIAQELPMLQTIYYQIGNVGDNKIIGVTVYSSSESDILNTFTAISNLIYDRQTVDCMQVNGVTNFTLDLPAKRLIVMAQSDVEELSAQQIEVVSGGLGSDIDISYQSLKPEEINVDEESRGNIRGCDYYAAAQIYGADASLIAPGNYAVRIPDSATVKIYAEYDVQYTVILTDAESGKEWNLQELENADRIREGDYRIEVKCVNTLNGKMIQDASVYNKLECNLFLTQDDERIPVANGQEIHIWEGDFSLEGETALKGNYPDKIQFEVSVGHRLGEITLDADLPEGGFDIDEVVEGRGSFYVRILEDGADIFDSDVHLTAELVDCKYFECRTEELTDRWEVTLALQDDVSMEKEMLGPFGLTLTVEGEKDGETFERTKAASIFFFASPQNILVQMEKGSAIDAWDLFFGKSLSFVPTVLGKEIDIEKWVKDVKYQVSFLDEEMSLEAQLQPRKWKPLEFKLSFIGLWEKCEKLWSLRSGGKISAQINIEMERYGQLCSGSQTFLITLEPIPFGKKIGIVALLVLGFYLLWFLLVKWICKGTFRWLPIKIAYEARYGDETVVGDTRPQKVLLRNLLRPFSSLIIVPLEKMNFLGFSSRVPQKLIIKRFWNKFFIVNIKDFDGNGYVLNGGKPMKDLDRFIDLRNGLKLTLLGEDKVNIRIYWEER